MIRLVKFVSITEQIVTYSSLNKFTKQYILSDLYVNKNFIIKVTEDLKMIEMLLTGKLPVGFDNNQKFTLLTISKGNIGEDISVIGSLDLIIKKLEE